MTCNKSVTSGTAVSSVRAVIFLSAIVILL
jgi:hypothetical protein